MSNKRERMFFFPHDRRKRIKRFFPSFIDCKTNLYGFLMLDRQQKLTDFPSKENKRQRMFFLIHDFRDLELKTKINFKY